MFSLGINRRNSERLDGNEPCSDDRAGLVRRLDVSSLDHVDRGLQIGGMMVV